VRCAASLLRMRPLCCDQSPPPLPAAFACALFPACNGKLDKEWKKTPARAVRLPRRTSSENRLVPKAEDVKSLVKTSSFKQEEGKPLLRARTHSMHEVGGAPLQQGSLPVRRRQCASWGLAGAPSLCADASVLAGGLLAPLPGALTPLC